MSKKRVLPVVVLVCGVLAGAGWAAEATLSHAEAGTTAARVLTSTTAGGASTTATTAKTGSASSSTARPSSRPRTKPSGARTKQATPSAASVQAAVRSAEPSATVGTMVVDRATGRTLLTLNGSRQFHSASLVKLLIAIDVLPRDTDPEVRNQIATMLRLSDDALASKYWVRQGGSALVTRVAAKLGLHDTEPPDIPGRWGNTELSPRDLVTIYEYILNRMSANDRTTIVQALASAAEHASDGFDQWFGIPDGIPKQQWAIKQGWSSSATDICLHTTGLVGKGWRYIVVLLTEHPRGTSFSTGTRSATFGARAMAALFP